MKCNEASICRSFEARLRDYADKQLYENNYDPDFPSEIENMTADSLVAAPCVRRVDLRNIPCITIDCDDTKDMDDAISLEYTNTGYRLGIHIADVATYIPFGSALDEEAFYRGSSIYLPHQTIPMLPSFLSNDLCSLNPNVDRLVISVMVDMDMEANVLSYCIQKSIIRSRVMGKYSEVNAILQGYADSQVHNKYDCFLSVLRDMQSLAEKLRHMRTCAGATCTLDNEPRIVVAGHSIDIIPNEKGVAGQIVEEFMILANRLVAEYFIDYDLPVVFRAQSEKGFVAIYTTEKCHHAELALDHYAHFTSPIRRLADLKIHQVLTEHLNGMSNTDIHDMFDEHLEEAADRAKRRKGSADNITNACRNYCIKMWAEMKSQEIFSARVVGVNKQMRTVVEILPYRFKVIGEIALKAYTSKVITCQLVTNQCNNKLLAVATHVVA